MVQDVKQTTTAMSTNQPTSEPPSDDKRKKVGNYMIFKSIGEGSFAKVRLGVHLQTQMKVSFDTRPSLTRLTVDCRTCFQVAVKVINKREVFQRNYLRANLRREASMMQRMSHVNIVQLHEVMETDNSYYIVMDLVEGNEFVKYLTDK
jgi:hormonally upregulated Neu-associated kinase